MTTNSQKNFTELKQDIYAYTEEHVLPTTLLFSTLSSFLQLPKWQQTTAIYLSDIPEVRNCKSSQYNILSTVIYNKITQDDNLDRFQKKSMFTFLSRLTEEEWVETAKLYLTTDMVETIKKYGLEDKSHRSVYQAIKSVDIEYSYDEIDVDFEEMSEAVGVEASKLSLFFAIVSAYHIDTKARISTLYNIPCRLPRLLFGNKSSKTVMGKLISAGYITLNRAGLVGKMSSRYAVNFDLDKLTGNKVDLGLDLLRTISKYKRKVYVHTKEERAAMMTAFIDTKLEMNIFTIGQDINNKNEFNIKGAYDNLSDSLAFLYVSHPGAVAMNMIKELSDKVNAKIMMYEEKCVKADTTAGELMSIHPSYVYFSDVQAIIDVVDDIKAPSLMFSVNELRTFIANVDVQEAA